jgi:ABC-type oligopeptide transport system ATPase subunit
MNPLLTLSILAQIINFLNDFQESFNFEATIQSFAQPLWAKNRRT